LSRIKISDSSDVFSAIKLDGEIKWENGGCVCLLKAIAHAFEAAAFFAEDIDDNTV
jgi:hypothetical protein